MAEFGVDVFCVYTFFRLIQTDRHTHTRTDRQTHARARTHTHTHTHTQNTLNPTVYGLVLSVSVPRPHESDNPSTAYRPVGSKATTPLTESATLAGIAAL